MLDSIGFVLIVLGAGLTVYQFMVLLSGLIVTTAMAGKFNKFTVNIYVGYAGILLAMAGVLVRYFG